MKKDILKKIYFKGANDSDLKEFTEKFLASGLLWIYIGLNPDKQWELIFEGLNKKNRQLFIKEYNKAFLYTRIFSEAAKLFLGKKIALENIFLPGHAETFPEYYAKIEQSDIARWKEALELVS